MQRIIRITQLCHRRLNYILWLNCGHQVAIFAADRPKKTDYVCPVCSYMSDTAENEAEEQREQSGGAI